MPVLFTDGEMLTLFACGIQLAGRRIQFVDGLAKFIDSINGSYPISGILLEFDAASAFGFGFRLLFHLALTFGECILVFAMVSLLIGRV